MTFRKFPYYCVLFIVTLSTLFLSCNNILLEKKDADFSVKISMPPVYSTTTSSDPVTGGDISTESPAEKWNLIAWVEEAGTKKQLGYEEKKAVDGTVAIYFENIPIGKYIHVFVEVYSATGDLCYKGSSEGKEPHLVEDTNKKISISLDKYYKVIFYNGNEIVETKYIKQGETAGKPKDLTGENPFKGWSTQEPSPEYTQEIYDFNEPITKNLSLYAVWGEKGSNEPGNPGDSEGETGGSGNTGNTEEEFNFKCNYIFKIGDSDDFPDSVENASYENGVITVNYPDRSGSVWDYYARAIQDKDGEAIFGEGNYKISLDMKAEKPTVVGIQAAYADMFFTVGTEWATYEFETGYIDVVPSNDAGYGKNGITIGSALTEKLYFNNVKVEQLIENDGLPTLVFNITPQGIENYLKEYKNKINIDPSTNKITNGIVKVTKNDETNPTGYDITINTPIVSESSILENDCYNNDVSLQLRGYANKGMNKVSVDVIPLNSSSFYTSILSQPFSKKTLSWNNSPVSISESGTTALYDYFPSYEETDVVTVDILSRSSSNTSSESTSFSIENFNIENIKPVEEEDFAKTILVQKESSWYEFNDNNNMEILIEKSGNIQIVMIDKNLWDKGVFPTEGWEKITRIYHIEGISTTPNGDFISFGDSISFPITLSLTDDFTVQITEVEEELENTNGDVIVVTDGSLQYSDDYVLTIKDINGLENIKTFINEQKKLQIKNYNGYGTDKDILSSEKIPIKLDTDITISDWTPIGTSDRPFTGSFDGQGHTITINSIYETYTGDSVGLFGNIQGATISNLAIKGTISSNATNVGAIAGS